MADQAMIAVSLAVGVIGLAVGVFFGWRLWRWEQQLAGARIAIAYKQKVKLQAPLVEWLKWGNLLRRDERSTGRVVYRMGHTSVAILKPQPHPKTKTRTVKQPDVTPVTRNK